MNIIFFGPPGAGKGTQTNNVVKDFKYFKVSTGDLLRDEISKKTLLGQEIKSIIDAGHFVSDNIINSQPTDGLWDDGRNDVQQLGMSYQELEKAMDDKSDINYKKYLKIREKNLHKINPIPVCKFDE